MEPTSYSVLEMIRFPNGSNCLLERPCNSGISPSLTLR